MTTTVQPTVKPPTIFGREPALLLGGVNAAIVLFSAILLPLDTVQQGVLNAVAAAVCGLVVAIRVQGGTWAAATITLLQALIAVALAFNFQLSPEIQSGVMVFATAVLAFITRERVVADLPAQPGSARTA